MTAQSSATAAARTEWTRQRWLDAFHREAAAFRAALVPQRLTDPVPSCPGWTVNDLVAHLGGVYRWHREHLVRRSVVPPDHTRPAVPADAGVIDWWESEYAAMAAALEEAGADEPAWNWSVQPKRASFWHRRMAHETAVHRWDAQRAFGSPELIDAELAVDGVAEVLDTFLPSGRTAGPTDRHGTVLVNTTDAPAAWRVFVHGAEVALAGPAGADSGADCEVAGPAAELLLVLWGRTPAGPRLSISGEAGLLAALRSR